jgi:hypothetical protein
MCDHCGCREFPGIAELSAEHETILELAWQVAEGERAGQAADATVVGILLDQLDRHVDKEELALYPLLISVGDLAPETSDALEDEHRSLRATLVDGRFDRRQYYALAAHIEAEEMELFPAAMFAFDDETWDELDAVHRRVDSPPIPDAHLHPPPGHAHSPDAEHEHAHPHAHPHAHSPDAEHEHAHPHGHEREHAHAVPLG